MKDKAESGSAKGPKGVRTRQQKPAYDSPEWRSVWLRSVDAARSVWSKLPYNDLAQTGGVPQKLTALIATHYKLTEAEATRQVMEFLEQC